MTLIIYVHLRHGKRSGNQTQSHPIELNALRMSSPQVLYIGLLSRRQTKIKLPDCLTSLTSL